MREEILREMKHISLKSHPILVVQYILRKISNFVQFMNKREDVCLSPEMKKGRRKRKRKERNRVEEHRVIEAWKKQAAAISGICST